MFNKLKDEKGSTFILALMLLSIVAIITTVLFSYVLNQIKTTKKTQESIEEMYVVEGGIEQAISEFISNIKIEPPTDGIIKSEIPKYISNDSVIHRLGRYMLTLVEEVGIINGNMSHTNPSEMNATLNNIEADWANKTIGNYINDSQGLVYYLNLFNNSTWRVLDSKKYLKTQEDIDDCQQYLSQIDLLLIKINKELLNEKQNNSSKLKSQDILYIKENIESTQNISLYLRHIVDKNSKSSGYMDYEYFISPSDENAEDLNTVLDNIIDTDLEILNSLLEKSIMYIENMPIQITNLDKIKYNNQYVWPSLKLLSNNINGSKDSLINNIKEDLNKSKNAKSNESKLEYVVSASIKINKIIVIIGEIHADNILNLSISKNLDANQNTGELSGNKTSLARVNVQNARRTLKGSQLVCDFIQHKLSKSILNIYKDKSIIGEISSDIQKIKITDESNKTYEVYNLVSDELKELETQISHTTLLKYRTKDELLFDYIRKFDDSIKNIISISDNISDQKNLSKIIGILEEQCNVVSVLNDNKFNQDNYIAERKLNEVIKILKNLEIIFNNLVIENKYVTTTFNSENNVRVKFNSLLSQTNNNTKKLYVDIDDLEAKVKIKNSSSDNNFYLLSKDDIDKCILSINPSRDLEFNMEINSSINSSNKNRIKVDVNIYIKNMVVILDDKNKPKSVTYNINYDILGMNKGD